MADLEDLKYSSIVDMSNDEAIDLLRQIRLNRRTPNKPTTKVTTTKQKQAKVAAAVDSTMAAELLKLLEG